MPAFELLVKGEKVVMNEFVNNVIHDVIMAVVSHLRDIEIDEIKRVEIS
ncbi:MAG: hypothetical protein ACW97A_01900 [Candidatus Thorarchaeota archaeon]|jgi:hypothetical protein